ncbi:hypothetical protein R6Q57_016098 [Mikania cordata]
MNWGFNFSKFILNYMKGNLKGSKSEMFMMYPRFLQMIFDEIFPGLQRGWRGKYKFEGLHSLKKFGQFAEIHNADVAEEVNAPNAVVEEEHDVDIAVSRSADDDVYFVKLPEYEDVVTGDEADIDFDFEMETVPDESNHSEQVNLLTTENPEALFEHVKRNPPLDTTADLVPRKRRRRDPRPRFVVAEPETELIAETQIQTTIVEPTESSPNIREAAAGSSSHIEDIDYDSFLAGEIVIRVDKGNNVLPQDEPIDIVKLQSRVFELEQDSLSQTLLIQELKTDNELKDKKIKDLETNMGHLSAIVLDLKQKLQDKFKGEFIDESSPTNTAEPVPEMSKADFDELTRSREEGLRKYFAGDTGFKVSIAKSRELMMTTDRTIQKAKDASKFEPTRFIVDVGDNRYNYEGDISGIFYWGYDEVKEMWWIRRKLNKRIEYYDHPSSFKLLMVVDMVELARQRFFNTTKNK